MTMVIGWLVGIVILFVVVGIIGLMQEYGDAIVETVLWITIPTAAVGACLYVPYLIGTTLMEWLK